MGAFWGNHVFVCVNHRKNETRGWACREMDGIKRCSAGWQRGRRSGPIQHAAPRTNVTCREGSGKKNGGGAGFRMSERANLLQPMSSMWLLAPMTSPWAHWLEVAAKTRLESSLSKGGTRSIQKGHPRVSPMYPSAAGRCASQKAPHAPCRGL